MLLILSLFIVLAQAQTSGSAASSQMQSAADVASLQSKAESGDVNAQFLLGKAFEEGFGGTQSDEEAAKWYRTAAAQGHAAAEDGLGVLLWTGRGVQKNKVEAVKWYRRAAKQGNGSAMFNLGTAYYNGEGGIRESTLRAYIWFLLAQDHASTLATDAVQRSEKTAKPHELIDAYLSTARMYVRGEEIPQDYSAAVNSYQKAVARGSTVAAVELAAILYSGSGGEPNYNDALRWCQWAADRGNPRGMHCVGRLYNEGRIGPRNPAETIRWFEKAAAAGDLSVCLQLERMYWNGDGAKADKVTAYKWALLASETMPSGKQWIARQDVGSIQSHMSVDEIEQGKIAAQDFKKSMRVWTGDSIPLG